MGSKKKEELLKTQNNEAVGDEGEIVISGISGKFPESSNIEEFKHNLLNGIDMVTDDPRRWEAGTQLDSYKNISNIYILV